MQLPPEDAQSATSSSENLRSPSLVTMLLRNIASAGSYDGFCNHQAQSY